MTVVRKHLHAPQQRTDDDDLRPASIAAAFATQAHTIAWTELENPSDLAQVDEQPGYDTYWPGGRNSNGTPRNTPANFATVSWRTDTFTLVHGESVRACDGRSGVSPHRYANLVILDDRQLDEHTVRHALHMVAGLDSRKAPYAYRVAAHADCRAAFEAQHTAYPLTTIGGTDANTTRLRAMVPDIRFAPKVGPTHGTREIDYIAHRVTGSGNTFRSMTRVKLGHSDHMGLLATYHHEEPTVDRFISTAEWGANPSKEATEDSHPIGSTKGITAHWEGPHMGPFTHSQCAEKVRGIERHHEYGRGWGDIAYNALVCPHGYVFEGRGAGVRSAANGGTQSNEDWYAVCYLGGEGDGFTAEGKAGFLWAFDWLTREGDAGPGRNGHRDHKATQCPGGAIYAWVHSSAARANPTPDPEPVTDTEEDDMASSEVLALLEAQNKLIQQQNKILAGIYNHAVTQTRIESREEARDTAEGS